MVLHYAHLAEGGRRRRRVRHRLRAARPDTRCAIGAATYPFVAALVALAADVQVDPRRGHEGHLRRRLVGVLRPPARATARGDVYFHLDPLWARPPSTPSASIVYGPLADWRDGATTSTALAGARSIYDLAYLQAQHRRRRRLRLVLRQPTPTAPRRRARRSPTAPASRGSSAPRTSGPGGATSTTTGPAASRAATPTAWVPQIEADLVHGARLPRRRQGRQPAQRLRRSEKLGDRAAVFLARRAATISSSAATCRRFIEAFDPGSTPGYVAGLNPVSSVYGGADARSRPRARLHLGRAALSGVPRRRDDLGRRRQLAARPLAQRPPRAARRSPRPSRTHARRLRLRRLRRLGTLDGIVPGYVIDRMMSAARGAAAAGTRLLLRHASRAAVDHRFRHRGAGRASPTLDRRRSRREPRRRHSLTLTRGAGDRAAGLGASSPTSTASSDYQQAVAEARRLTGAQRPRRQADLPLVPRPSSAAAIAETWLFETWAARERASFTLPPSRLALEPGDHRQHRTPAATRVCSASPRSASTASARSRRAGHRSGRLLRRRAARSGRRPAALRARSPARRCVAVPRPAAVARRRAARGGLRRRGADAVARRGCLLPLAREHRLHAQSVSRRRRRRSVRCYDLDPRWTRKAASIMQPGTSASRLDQAARCFAHAARDAGRRQRRCDPERRRRVGGGAVRRRRRWSRPEPTCIVDSSARPGRHRVAMRARRCGRRPLSC